MVRNVRETINSKFISGIYVNFRISYSIQHPKKTEDYFQKSRTKAN